MDPDAKRNAWQPDDEHASRFKLSEHRNRDAREKDVARPMGGLTLSESVYGVEKISKSKSKSPKPKSANKEKDGNEAPKKKAGKDAPKEGAVTKEKKLVAPKIQKDKGEEETSLQSNRAPFELVQKVKEFGRKPLYDYLLVMLDKFKKSEDYEQRAEQWDLINEKKCPSQKDFARITPQELYEKFMFGKTEGAQRGARVFGVDFLRSSKFNDRYSWDCMKNFESMLKEKTTYEEFMELFKVNMEKIGAKLCIPFADDNPEAIAALQKCFGKYWDHSSEMPQQLSKDEKADSEKMWKKEMVRMDKGLKNAQEKAEKDSLKEDKLVEKENERIRFDRGGAPPKLVKIVNEFGRKPLYGYLLVMLDEFKKSEDYELRAEQWDLINEKKCPSQKDFARITPQELYEKFMFGKSKGAQRGARVFKDDFLRNSNFNDRYSWDCMKNFESMLKEKTTYEEFMELFKDNMEKIGARWVIPFADENPDAIAALQKCYDKYKDLSVDTAWTQK